MTFFEWIRECLRQEATRTAPDGARIMQEVMEAYQAWKKKE